MTAGLKVHTSRGEYGRNATHPRLLHAVVAATFATFCAFALPAAPAFGEGSLEYNTGPGTATRHALLGDQNVQVYAQTGETLELGSSVVGVGAGTIRVFAPGADPATATPLVDCVIDQAGSGHIASRPEEQAGSDPDGSNPGGWTPCVLPAPTNGVYTVQFAAEVNNTNGIRSTVDAPFTGVGQNSHIAIWDVTVRDATDAVREGRLFSTRYSFGTAGPNDLGILASNTNSYVYTKTGYEYRVNFFNHTGINWTMTADDMGVVDAVTGDRIYGSFEYAEANLAPVYPEAVLAPASRQFPQFINPVDPEVISGPGGLVETRGFSATAIAPSTQPLANLAFSGPAGQAGAAKRGEGGTIDFTSPQAMEALGYTLAIDTNRDGSFGNANDFVDRTRELESDGTNSYAWNGRDAAGNVPACGDYQYQVRSTLAEVHFTANDVEESGGMQIERLSRPTDPDLGGPTLMSYNDIDRYKADQVTDTVPAAVTNGDSSIPPFHAWDNNTGDTAYVDTWTKLPDVQSTGTLRLLCADPQIVKTADPSPAVPGENLTFRLEVRNNGPDTATDVVVRDDLPPSVSFRSASAGCAAAGGVVTCNVGSLAPGASRTFEVVVAVRSNVDQCIDNTGTVTNSTPDTNLTNNSSNICVPIRGRSDLSIAKSASRTEVGPNGQLMFTLVVRNDGPSDDPGVEVRDPLVAGLTVISAEPSQGKCSTADNVVDCELGRLRDGGSAQVLVTVQMSATACITNVARVRGARVDPTPANNQDSARVCPTTVEPPPFDLVVSKTVNDRKLVIGQTARYRIVVRNNGPAAAAGVKLTDTLNAPVSVVSVKTTAGSCSKRIPLRCELGTIAANASVTITIRAKHRVAGCNQRNAASATGEGTDTNPANNMDTVAVCVTKVKPRLSKVASRFTVAAGQTFSYRIRVWIPGRGEARNLRVCDRLPSGIGYVSSNPNAKRQGARVHCWTIKALKAGKPQTFRVAVRAARGAIGRKVNTATLTSRDISRRLRARDTVQILGVATPITG